MRLSRRATDLFPQRLTYRYWLPKVIVATFATLLYQAQLAGIDPSISETAPERAGSKVVWLDSVPPVGALVNAEFYLGKDRPLLGALKELGVKPKQIEEILEGFKPHQDQLIRLPKGARLLARITPGPIRQVEQVRLEIAPEYVLELARADYGSRKFELKQAEEAYTIRVVTYANTVKSTIWESAAEVSMDTLLIAELADIFAWQVDFSREVRRGDRWRLAVEERYLDGKRVGWGRILAAEFENDGDTYTALLYRRDWNEVGYFTPEGTSLRRMFLKSPIAYRRISSRFTNDRFHPILKQHRPHLGVDYSAARGTPVRSVGDGTVLAASFSAQGGNAIKIAHTREYTSAYKHLNAFAPGIAAGSKVKQGQVIGYVGSTGLATGSHLHFEFYERGRYVDPLGKKWPSADPVTERDRPVFQKFAYAALRTLPDWVRPATASFSPVVSRAPTGAVDLGGFVPLGGSSGGRAPASVGVGSKRKPRGDSLQTIGAGPSGSLQKL